MKTNWAIATLLSLGIVSSFNLFKAEPNTLAQQQSPYVSELDSPVRGLTAQAVDDLLNGRGAGYAMTAELNSYPGPRHVLDLRQELALSPEQIQRIEAIFQQMNEEAERVGQAIVEREEEFSNAFASGTITEAEIEAQTQELALLYGAYRAIHLQPHFKIKHLLSPEQVARYDQLRGYSNLETQSTPNPHHQNR
ncbi:MAG TPA: Spy/CpxP family protein refolding chaperone [Leptolyngbyaceae cyanobacterium M33_DOE_097]|uniref:Periplasmic heavy metal sensor n=1 Tax=Oscillatoriales cyanobacterium SpSt-418 TaxID=2282169 RepID=A0A7C3KKC7_9CYAN|nr:Spy/CpxP family protein refolding chaperone [Leptolyngbyaceae cyanobacterium M33_DOE_097]